jgi:tetratricopeptide (TPR) repeat protein
LFADGKSLLTLGAPAAAVSAFEKLIRRYRDTSIPDVQVFVIWARLNRASTLLDLDRADEALVEYDVVRDALLIDQGSAIDDSVFREQCARAEAGRAVALRRTNRAAEAIKAAEEVIVVVGDSERPSLRALAAAADNTRALALSERGEYREALLGYDRLLRRFGDDIDLETCSHVARAYVNKGRILERLGRDEDALGIYEALLSRGTAGQFPNAEGQIAAALNNKGRLLSKAGLFRAAVETYEELIHSFARRVAQRRKMRSAGRSYT